MPSARKTTAPATSAQSAPAKTTEPVSKKRKMDGAEQKYYAVRAGYKPGVYTSWAICQQQISGFKGAVFKSFLSYEDASAFAAGRDPPSTANDKPDRFYGVAVGRKPGVYTEWTKVQEAIIGWKGPKYKKFETRAEAEAFVRTYGKTVTMPDVSGLDGEEAEVPPAKKAKKAAKPTPSGANVLVVYTDGSSLGNGRSGASAGVGVFFGVNDPRNISERLEGPVQTNQRAELTAILRALEVADDTQDVEIRTDSKYSIQCVTEWYINWERNGWRTRDGPVKNQDLVQAIRTQLEHRESQGGQTQFIWVKGHDTDVGNIAADHLAVEGARK
ncbi:Ribonuclease H [Madurella mycetomatis]|uniref:Ribonuclease H n=1 Tax=Madurella mycetomatis TaxID=100816 RepID=A0A175WBS7_9PEZI|nr:Ribonuclease H [Madurella mycetomatis]KXX81022.1 Ribonuclease H [Madurella mycetomatis]